MRTGLSLLARSICQAAQRPVLLSVGLHDDLVEMPAPVGQGAHPVDPPAPNLGSKHWAEPVPPAPHGLMVDVDAAFMQQVFDVAEREGGPHIHKHRKANTRD